MPSPYYRLRIKSLKFISAVDAGAQGPIANVALIKRAPTGSEVDATCQVVKIDEKMGLVFGWALATSLDGGATPHIDLQQDAIVGDDELIKIAAEFMEASAASDVMHDDSPDGKIVFCYPLTKAVTDALGIASKVHGLAIGMRPSPATFKRFVSKELSAFSIAGIGERELVKSDATACPGCGKYGKATDETCKDCGGAMKRVEPAPAVKALLSTADKDSLPDSAFLYVESGGTKEGGKTTPLSLRHFPYRDSAGKMDVAHLRAACSDIPKSSLPKDVRDKLQVRAEKLLGTQHMAAKRAVAHPAPPAPPAPVAKGTALTGSVEGHQHSIVLTDPADQWRGGGWSTSYQVSDGADMTHCHALTFDPITGAITVAEDSGHTHPVEDVVPDEIRAQVALNDTGRRCSRCNAMCEATADYCPGCGASLGSCGVPAALSDDNQDSKPAIVVISASISTPSARTSSVGDTKESNAMADHNDRIRDLEAANGRLEKMATLTDGQRAHFSKLSGADATQFLNLAPPLRDAQLAQIAKSDEIVYTSPVSGKVYRKSAQPEILELVQQADAATMAQRTSDIEKRNLQFAKKGDEVLSNFAKGIKGELRARVMKALDAEFTDATEYAEAVTAFKQGNAALAEITKAKGYTPGAGDTLDTSPQAELDRLAGDYAKAHNVPIHKAHSAVLDTPAGAAIYARMPVGGRA